MKAAIFYPAFVSGFEAEQLPSEMKRVSKRPAKWSVATRVGNLLFAFGINPKSAGLLPHHPGEFMLRIFWSNEAGEREVSFLQYITAEEAFAYATQQRVAVEKCITASGEQTLRLFNSYASDPSYGPRANIQEYCYVFDEDDVAFWARWFGGLMSQWLDRFLANPVSWDDWCDLMWAERKKREKGHAS